MTVRIGAIGDLHYGRESRDMLKPVLQAVEDARLDVLLLLGDLGNHDCEANAAEQVRDALREGGIVVLDGDSCEVKGVGFAGVKGFCGGFGRGALGPWGEDIVKLFVREAVNEAFKLESALARLRSQHRVALLHYSPIRATVEGEPLEIFPYLGSSRLEEPLARYPVSAVIHGHAHNGALEGRTQTGIPVFNVAHAVLEKNYPDRAPFRLFEVHTAEPTEQSVTPISDRPQRGRRSSDRGDSDSQVANPSP